MLGLVDSVLVDVEPVLTPGEFALRATKPNAQGKGRLYLYHDNQIIETGRSFFLMEADGQVIINGRSGEFTLGKGASATFRCVFAGQHLNLEIAR